MALPNLLLGLVFSALVAVIALRRGSLSTSGVLGAVIVGTLIFGSGGWGWGLLLVCFFVTSSALSAFRLQVKEPLAEKFQKGHRRDLGQVLANGGWGAVLALGFSLSPHPLWIVGFVGAMATVNADTWATELGVLSESRPRLITTGRPVPTGTSGGITWLGTFVALGGAALIGTLAWVLGMFDLGSLAFLLPAADRHSMSLRLALLIPVAGFAGLLGSLFDSFLGATVQGIYYCEFDRKETESALHRCGRPTRLIRGWRWMDNDWVNFLSSVAGSAVAAALYALV